MSINGLEITEVATFPVKKAIEGSKLKAFAKIVFNGALVISGVRIVDGKNGLFIGFPQDYDKETQKGYDIAFPITAELRNECTEKILAQYALADQ